MTVDSKPLSRNRNQPLELERPKFHVFECRGGWTWVLRAGPTDIDASAFSSWTNKAACVKAVEKLKTTASEYEIVVED